MENFTDSIYKILKQLHPDIQLSKEAKLMLNKIANKFLLHFDDIMSFQDSEVKNYIDSQGNRAVKNYNINPSMINPAKAANLQISPKKVQKVLPNKEFKEVLYISGGLEYFIGELLELAGNMGPKRITPKHIEQLIFDDEELQEIIEILCDI